MDTAAVDRVMASYETFPALERLGRDEIRVKVERRGSCLGRTRCCLGGWFFSTNQIQITRGSLQSAYPVC